MGSEVGDREGVGLGFEVESAIGYIVRATGGSAVGEAVGKRLGVLLRSEVG